MMRSAPRARYAHQSITMPPSAAATPQTISDLSSAVERATGLRSGPGEEFAREAGEVVVDGRELGGAREEHDAEVAVFGTRAESGSVHAQHAGRAQQAKDVVFVRDAGRQRDARHRVERR